MAKYPHKQQDFSGGEISGRIFMRDDMAMYAKSVASMRNFIPTLQGTAVRTPGTRYVSTVASGTRIVPFLTQANDETLVVIEPASSAGADDGTISLYFDIADRLRNSVLDGPVTPGTPTTVMKNIVTNGDFREGLFGWWANPPQYTSNGDDALLGTWLVGNTLILAARDWKYNDNVQCFLAQKMVVPEDTDLLSFRAAFTYVENFSGPDAKFTASIAWGTQAFGDDIFRKEYNNDNFGVGSTEDTPFTIDTFADGSPLSLTAGQEIWFQFTMNAVAEPNKPSSPQFVFYNLSAQSKATVIIPAESVGSVPYTADELKALQYVQSPYTTTDGSGGKQLVFAQAQHSPKELRFAGGVYQLRDIPFSYEPVGGGPSVEEPPTIWDLGYPAACTSFNGRLILAGAEREPITGGTVGNPAETVWGSYVGVWNRYTDPDADQDPNYAISAADSIEFTAIYRSPIQWVYGQKELLIGSREYEYVASADTLFQPSDIGVSMHSSHGSVPVQPVAIGETVLFAADGGTRVRAMNFRQDTEGYTAPDMTFWHPYLFQSKIVRSFRLRNPHQIAGFVMGNGQIALLSIDPQAGVAGWSRLDLNAVVKDACVLQNSDGEDVLFIVVERVVGGDTVTMIEAFVDWNEFTDDEYLWSSVRYKVNNTNVLTGLDHLNGERVQVVGDGNYLGTYQVLGGEVTLIDDLGQPINVASALVGLPMRAVMQTLPIVTQDPGAKKRFVDITVRGVFSTRVLINGKRPSERDPASLMDVSQPVDFLRDNKVVNLGTDAFQFITVEETVPYRSEIIGIFGDVKVSSL